MDGEFGFIGTGNMGGALACALVKTVDAASVRLANRTKEKAQKLAEKTGAVVSSNEEIAASCRYIILGVKPQMMQDTLKELQPVFAARTDEFVLVSMAAALPVSKIQSYAGGAYPVIRIMPNTPVAVGEGVVMYCASENARKFVERFTDAFSAAGLVDAVPEEFIDAGSVITGCAPAYADLFLEGIAAGARDIGFPEEKIARYAAQMLLGSAKLALESGESFSALRIKVCSPGGSTIEGIKTMQEKSFPDIVREGMQASYRRTLEMKGS